MLNLKERLSESLEHRDMLIKQAQIEIDAAGTSGEADNKSRTIVHDERYIYLHLKQQNVNEVLTYSPDLFLFLADKHLCSYSCRPKKGCRTYVELRCFYGGDARCTPSLGAFAHYYYKSGLPAERFMLSMPKIMAEKRELKLEIDHVDSDCHNHSRWNLAEMSSRENNVKNDIVAKIKPPHYFFPAVTPSGEYRVECGWVVPCVRDGGLCLEGQKRFVLCGDTASFISCLKSFRAYCKTVNKSTMKGYFAGDFETSTCVAEKLIEMDEEEFFRWTVDSEWGHMSAER